MKSVLISIQPKWCEKIASGEKTIEVRKTRPKIETPFKCDIYCTQGDALAYPCLNNPKFNIQRVNNGTLKGRQMTQKERERSDYSYANGKVIGEFICEKIDEYLCEEYEWDDGDVSLEYRIRTVEGEKTCLEYDEVREYGNEKPLYFWHISNLKIYDKPKDLSEFYIYDGEKRRPSIDCEHKKPGYSHDWCLQMDGRFCNQCLCDKKRLTRPPQSWCYIESGVQCE